MRRDIQQWIFHSIYILTIVEWMKIIETIWMKQKLKKQDTTDNIGIP